MGRRAEPAKTSLATAMASVPRVAQQQQQPQLLLSTYPVSVETKMR
jgi:hypothetical protein